MFLFKAIEICRFRRICLEGASEEAWALEEGGRRRELSFDGSICGKKEFSLEMIPMDR